MVWSGRGCVVSQGALPALLEHVLEDDADRRPARNRQEGAEEATELGAGERDEGHGDRPDLDRSTITTGYNVWLSTCW